MDVKRGNYKTLSILVKDSDGDAVTDLATADEIYFMVKSNKTDADVDAVISVVSAAMTLNSPSTGYITIPLTSAQTTIDPGSYFAALQIDYGATGDMEINLSENGIETSAFIVTQDIVRG